MRGQTANSWNLSLVAPVVLINSKKLILIRRLSSLIYVAFPLLIFGKLFTNETIIILLLILSISCIMIGLISHIAMTAEKQIGTIEFSKEGFSIELNDKIEYYNWADKLNLKLFYRLGQSGERNTINNQLGFTFIEFTKNEVTARYYFVFTFDQMATSFYNLIVFLNQKYPDLTLLNVIYESNKLKYNEIKNLK